MTRFSRWVIPPTAAMSAFAVIFAALSLGVRVPRSGGLGALPNVKPFDYTRNQFGSFDPLSARYIRDVLGGLLPETGELHGRQLSSLGHFHETDAGVERERSVASLSNDDFSRATPVDRVPYAARTDTTGATRQSGEPSTCGTLKGGTVWFRYRPPRNEGLIVNTFGSSYGTVLAIYDGSKLTDLRALDCDEDQRGNALVSFTAHRGTTYYMQVGTALLTGGTLLFRIERQGITSLASLGPHGEQANDVSGRPATSDDGRIIAFDSTATNLVDGFKPTCLGYQFSCSNVFARNRLTGETLLVSVGLHGEAGNDYSERPSLSADGRYVAFHSLASNLVVGDTNRCLFRADGDQDSYAPLGCYDVFVRDLLTGRTSRVSVSSSGEQGNGDSYAPEISADGRYIVFDSVATNLVADQLRVCPYPNVSVTTAPGTCRQVFVHDRVTGTTSQVSVNSAGELANGSSIQPSISADGRFTEFASVATNLAPGTDAPCPPAGYRISGFFTEIPCAQIYVHDRVAGTTTLISVTTDGTPARTDSLAAGSTGKGISADGRYVGFASYASDLVPNDTNGTWDVFIRDRIARKTTQITISSTGAEANADTSSFAISSDGRFVAFNSTASNLVPGDTNVCGGIYYDGGAYFESACADVFLRDTTRGTTIRISISSAGEEANNASIAPAISSNGRVIVFESTATNLAHSAGNGCGAGTWKSTASDLGAAVGIPYTCDNIYIHERAELDP